MTKCEHCRSIPQFRHREPASRRTSPICEKISGKVDEPQFKAMFETSAEVLPGLAKAFDDYERKNEAAWRR